MMSIDDITNGLDQLQQRLLFHRSNPRYRETAEVFYLEHLEELRDFPDQSYFQKYKCWLVEFTSTYQLHDSGGVKWESNL